MSPQVSLQVSPQVAKIAFFGRFRWDTISKAFIAVYSLDMVHEYGLLCLRCADKPESRFPFYELNRADLKRLYFNTIKVLSPKQNIA